MADAVLNVTEMTNWAVDLIGVTKTYGNRVHALRGVNVQVGRGEIFGLLGPNGAGKSTLVKIMMTIVRPNDVLGTILGRPIGTRRKLAVTGYLPEMSHFPAYLTGIQVLDYYSRLSKVPRSLRQERSGRWLDRLGLAEWGGARVSKYSKGMLRRLGLAQSLMNDPELLILDEPTDGLDPMGRRLVRTLLTELKAEGKTIFLNSHMLSELEMVCDRVAILHEGLVARQGTIKELTEHTVQCQIVARGELESARVAVEACGGVMHDDKILVKGDDVRCVNKIIDALREKDCLIESVEPRRFSLEDVFVEAVKTGGRTSSSVGAKIM